MAFIRSPQKWLQKPSGPVDPNLHSPLLVGAASLIWFGEGGNRPRDVLSGVSSIQADPALNGAGTAPAWGAAQPGFGRRYFGNANWNIGTADAFADADVYDVGSDDFSVFAAFTCTRSVAQLGGVIGKFDSDTKVGYALGVNTFNTSDGRVVGMFGSPHTELYSSPISAGKLCTAILSRAGSSVYFYVDGALAGGPSAVSGSLSNSKQLTLGALQQFLSSGNNKTQFFHDGFIFAAGLIKGRAWRQAEAAEFAEAPFSVFKPLTRRTIYLPATSAGETVVGAWGVSAVGAIGTVTATGGALAQPTGVQAEGLAGTVTVGIVETVSATGVSASGAVGTPTVTGGALVEQTGVSATGNIGSVTVAAGATAQATGVSAEGKVGTVTTAYDMAVSVSGLAAHGRVGTVTISGVGDATANATGVQAVGNIGTVTVAADNVFSVSGVSADGRIGTATATGGATVAVSGVSADGQVGSVTVLAGEVVSVSGVSAAGTVGTPTVTTGALAALAGVQAVGRLGNVGVLFDAAVLVTGLSAAGSVGTVVVQTGVAIARGPITPAIARGPITPAIARGPITPAIPRA